MSATRRPAEPAPAAGEVAAALEEASLVRLLVRTDGDALAAAGVLASALAERGVPFQVSPTATRAERSRRAARGDASATTLSIGAADGADVALPAATEPAAPTTAAIARELGATPDPALALAGAIAAGSAPEDCPELLEELRDRGAERRPGVGVPTADLADGLAHSTLIRAPFSGDPEAAETAIDDLGVDPESPGPEGRRSVASLVAIAATGGEHPKRAAETVDRVLSPLAIDGPFATVEGYADVLDALADAAPGAAIALAVDVANAAADGGPPSVRGAALDAWREHAQDVHASLAEASTGRYDGVFVVRVDGGPARAAARLVRDARSPEPVALAIGDGEAALAARDGRDVRPATAALAEATGGEFDGTARRGYVRFDEQPDETTVIEAVRGEL